MDIRTLYNHFPYPLKTIAASCYGYYLRWWRYGPNTEKLIEAALEREKWSPDRMNAWQEERLAFILGRAAKYVPFYRQRWENRRRAGDRASWEYLSNWDILLKDEVRNNSLAFLADDLNPNSLYLESTSGTTGKPLYLWCRRSMLQEWYALFEARWRCWYGLSLRDRWGMLGGQIVVPFEQSRPPFWVWNAGLNQLYFSLVHLRPDWVKYYVEAIKRYSLVYLYGYASAIYQLAYHLLQDGITIELKAAITDAEPLYDFQRTVISKAFMCPVYDTYSLGEMVTAASICQHGSRHMWPEPGIVEILTENGEPVETGHDGRLVATGLMNDAMPLIRYDTLDMAGLPQPSECGCGRTLPIIPSLFGRKDDAIFTKDGRRIFLLDIVFDPSQHIREAQIIQENLDYFRVRVVPATGWSYADATKIITAMRKRLGSVEIKVEPVIEIERTARGKFRVLISKVTNPEQRT